MVDGNTNLSQIVNKNVNEIKTWNNKGLKPSFFSTSRGATPDELVISIENEKNDLLKYKAIFDKIDCEKTESKFDCNKIKNNLNKVEAEYNDYKVNILKFK